MENKLQKFHEEFKALQEKYGIYVVAECEEQIDYDYEEESYVSGYDTYLGLYDEKGFMLAIIDWENELIEKEW